ncbi:MAG: hypothetical protein LBQ76_06105 [Candidatus Fibromonas sp.]|nr:hypothetical protein [Candidatus Fibromonas sp.]
MYVNTVMLQVAITPIFKTLKNSHTIATNIQCCPLVINITAKVSPAPRKAPA